MIKVNDIVVANCTYEGIVQGKEYIIDGIDQCPTCARKFVDVGIPLNPVMNYGGIFCICGNLINKELHNRWYYERRFSKPVGLNESIEEIMFEQLVMQER